MVTKHVVLLYVSIYYTYISQSMAKICRKSRAQPALLRRNAQLPAVFEHHLIRGPCGLCLLEFVANMWTCQTVPHSTNLHINCGLPLVYTVDCTTLILLCLLLVVVSTFEGMSTKTFFLP